VAHETAHLEHPVAQNSRVMVSADLFWLRDLCETFGPKRVMNTGDTSWLDVQRRGKVAAMT
jgi:hypothetical protein